MPRFRDLATMSATLAVLLFISQAWVPSGGKPRQRLESLAIKLKTRLATADLKVKKNADMRVLVVPFQGRGRNQAAPVICERLLREFLKEQGIQTVPTGDFQRVFRGNDPSRIYRPEVFKMLQETLFASHLVIGRVIGGGKSSPSTMEIKVFRLRDGRRVSYLRRKLRGFGKVAMTERYVSLWRPVVKSAL